MSPAPEISSGPGSEVSLLVIDDNPASVELVSAAVAQLDLADLYAASGKRDMARNLWAKVKDTDKDGAAGSIAAQKLTGQ